MFYSSFGILAIVLHIIINYDILIKNDLREQMPANSSYRQFLFGVMVYYVADICWGLLYDHRLITLTYIDTVIYFLSMVISVFLWSKYVIEYLNEDNLFAKLLRIAGYLILMFEIVNLIINFFTPVVFSFAEDGTYLPLASRYITLAIQIVFYTCASVYSLILAVHFSGSKRRHHLTVGLSGVTMAGFIILQAYDPFLPFYAIGCMLGTCLLHTFVLEDTKAETRKHLEELLNREKDHRVELESATYKAYTDSLTGVKNKRSFIEAEYAINDRIGSGSIEHFALIIFDLNGLKKINDTLGHEEGDKYIKEGCSLICRIFAHSPVYRIGGDEFAAILEGEDYDNRTALVNEFDKQIMDNRKANRVVISAGIDEFLKGLDDSFQAVLERADKKMYEHKAFLKGL